MIRSDWTRQLLAASVIGATLAGAAPLARSAECPAPRQPRISEPSLPLNIDKIKKQLRAYHNDAYVGDVEAVLADAMAYVEQRAGEVSKPALVLDIDETSLSNWRNLDANDFGFIADGPCNRLPKGPCGFKVWIGQHAADVITPTRMLFNAAKAKGVAVFFITGRHEADRNVTVLNLNQQKFNGWQKLVMRADNETEERSKIAAAGYAIIANVGDQQSDLDGGYADCPFKVPNPFYFIR
jgi:HAD superfamily, subfamily IIIB (Acid phosphatase)